MGLALLNGVEGEGPLQVAVDPEVNVITGIVVGAHLHEEVSSCHDLKSRIPNLNIC
jgi:hypothetical protein